MEPAKKEMSSSSSSNPPQRKCKEKPSPSPKTPSPPPDKKEAEAIKPDQTVDGGASDVCSDDEGPGFYVFHLPGMAPIHTVGNNKEDAARCAMKMVAHILQSRRN